MRVLVAIGSNLGDRASHLHSAVDELNRRAGKVCQTSSLYTTKPQYVTDQPQFLNAVLELETKLSPNELLLCFKDIEVDVGRTPSGIRYGPRILDVDILFYGTEIYQAQTSVGPLHIPHLLIHERDFVLRPLLDIAPDFIHPKLNKTIRQLYSELKSNIKTPPVPVLNLGANKHWVLGKKTYVMGIINATPDSFSADGKEHLLNPNVAVVQALDMIAAGVDIIDIGGESSRPGADPVSLQDELARVLPIIKGIRAKSSFPISIDTTKSLVAKAAIEAGANIVNDISAGKFDPSMIKTVAALRVPYIMMHMRGTPATMTTLKNYSNVVDEVINELILAKADAMAQGIPTWNIIVDPGIGFAKDKDLNLLLLRQVNTLTQRCAPCPVLIGASRKKFLGTICNKSNPKDRTFGTAATCSAAVCGGATIVRVHDVAEMVDVVKVSDAIWRD
ncbi:folic acid synthesis protein fol1 [Thraustotheca clavata]|uniref:Folic acid synthesis protein fol1 n=1 Tax=Thraustotheca clavata TaxID=74557 RepID=A0A1V9Z8H1_9STRA|nr:folic acid synthesis protein fol1 [Thraustotheca clavata]